MMDTIFYGILVLAIGLLVVFIGLIMLVILTKGLKVVSMFGKKEPEAEQSENKLKPRPNYTPMPQPAAKVVKKQPDHLEIAAVIAAAVASCDGDQVVVRSVRRMTQSNVWAHAGRSEQIAKRF